MCRLLYGYGYGEQTTITRTVAAIVTDNHQITIANTVTVDVNRVKFQKRRSIDHFKQVSLWQTMGTRYGAPGPLSILAFFFRVVQSQICDALIITKLDLLFVIFSSCWQCTGVVLISTNLFARSFVIVKSEKHFRAYVSHVENRSPSGAVWRCDGMA